MVLKGRHARALGRKRGVRSLDTPEAIDIMVKHSGLNSIQEDPSEDSAGSGVEVAEERLATNAVGTRKKRPSIPRKAPAQPIRPLSKPSTPKPPGPPQLPKHHSLPAFTPIDQSSEDCHSMESEEPLGQYSSPRQALPPPAALYLGGEEEDKTLWEWLRCAAEGLAGFFSVRPL